MAKESRLPYMQWYVDDWLNDGQLSRCSPATRAIWADALCHMHRDGRTGILKGTPEELARICRCTPQEMVESVKELEAKGAANSKFCHGVVTLVNRRMQREHRERENALKRQRNHRGTASQGDACHGSVTPVVTPSVTPLSRPVSRAPSDNQSQRIRSDIAKPLRNSVSQADVFQTLKKSDLSDARKLLDWMPSAVAAGIIGNSENDEINLVAAGRRSIRLGKRSPIGLFRTIVVGAKWSDLSDGDILEAAEAIKELRKASPLPSVPVLKSPPAETQSGNIEAIRKAAAGKR